MPQPLWPDLGGWDLSYLPADVFGPLYDGGSVKQAVLSCLETWLPTYIAEINRQLGAPVLAVPRSYLYRFDERPIAPNTSQLAVSVPRTADAPMRQADATRAVFQVQVTTCFAGVQDWNLSEAVAHAYGAAVKASLGQHPGLVETGTNADTGATTYFAETTLWHGFSLGSTKRSSTYYRVERSDVFHVVVANTMSPFGGPSVPSVLAPAAQPTVQTEAITVEQEA